MTQSAIYLPSANEFTISQIDLVQCLKMASSSSSREEFIEEAWKTYFLNNALSIPDPVKRGEQQRKLAGNVLIGLRNYQLVNDDDSLSLTEVGDNILDDQENVKKIFGVHLFERLCGYQVLEATNILRKKGVSPRSKKHLSEELTALGLRTKKGMPISPTTTDHQKFVIWLKWCGFFTDDGALEWQEKTFVEYLGKSSGSVSKLWSLSNEQYMFVKYLWDISSYEGEEFTVKSLIQDSQKKYANFIVSPDQIKANI